MVYGLSGFQEMARTHFSTVPSINPDNIEANVKLAVLEFYGSNIPESLRLLARAESIDPNHLELNVRLAEVYRVVGETERAVSYLEKANRIQPDNPEVVLRLAFYRLHWSDDCLYFYENKRSVITASRSQVRHPLNSGSIGRWKNYEQELTQFRKLLAEKLEPDCL